MKITKRWMLPAVAHCSNGCWRVIKLKSLLSEGTIACGECLTYAWKTAAKNYNNPKMKIVYGEVGNKWLSGGKRFKHAWVEDKG